MAIYSSLETALKKSITPAPIRACMTSRSPARALLIALSIVAVLGAMPPLGQLKKRKVHPEGGVSEQRTLLRRLQESIEHLTTRLTRIVSPTVPAGGFMLSPLLHASEYQAAIDYCWEGDFSDAHSEVLACNQ